VGGSGGDVLIVGREGAEDMLVEVDGCERVLEVEECEEVDELEEASLTFSDTLGFEVFLATCMLVSAVFADCC
jgi:hypothetical protein